MVLQCLSNKIQTLSWPRQYDIANQNKSCPTKSSFIIPFHLLTSYPTTFSSPNIFCDLIHFQLCCFLCLDSFALLSSLLIPVANFCSLFQIKLKYYIFNEACETLTVICLCSLPHHGTLHMLLILQYFELDSHFLTQNLLRSPSHIQQAKLECNQYSISYLTIISHSICYQMGSGHWESLPIVHQQCVDS